MTALGHDALRQLALNVLGHQSGSAAGGEAVAEAARRAYADLAQVSAPLIGQMGVDALTGRALQIARREYPWLGDTSEATGAGDPWSQLFAGLERQDPAVGAEGAAALFAAFAALLITFIGESLTRRLLRKAWPNAFSDARTQES